MSLTVGTAESKNADCSSSTTTVEEISHDHTLPGPPSRGNAEFGHPFGFSWITVPPSDPPSSCCRRT